MNSKLASERVVVSASFSFAGSAQRIWKIARADNLILKLLLILLATILIIGTWMLVACWYFVMYVSCSASFLSRIGYCVGAAAKISATSCVIVKYLMLSRNKSVSS
jgi:hypothetical protein